MYASDELRYEVNAERGADIIEDIYDLEQSALSEAQQLAAAGYDVRVWAVNWYGEIVRIWSFQP